MGRRGWPDPWLVAFVVVAALIVLAGVIALAVGGGADEDRREVRRFGDLECLYNVSRDEVESCVLAR